MVIPMLYSRDIFNHSLTTTIIRENPQQEMAQDFYRGLLAFRQASSCCGDTLT